MSDTTDVVVFQLRAHGVRGLVKGSYTHASQTVYRTEQDARGAADAFLEWCCDESDQGVGVQALQRRTVRIDVVGLNLSPANDSQACEITKMLPNLGEEITVPVLHIFRVADQESLVALVGEGVLIERFLGGNTNCDDCALAFVIAPSADQARLYAIQDVIDDDERLLVVQVPDDEVLSIVDEDSDGQQITYSMTAAEHMARVAIMGVLATSEY